MFGANMSQQSQSGNQMTEMNVVGGGVSTPKEEQKEGVKCPKCGAESLLFGNSHKITDEFTMRKITETNTDHPTEKGGVDNDEK